MLLGKVCMIIGGITENTCRIVANFAKDRCSIAFMARDKQAAERIQQALQVIYGVDSFFFHGNIESEEDLELFTYAVIGKYDKVDYLISNACLYGQCVNDNHNLEKMLQVSVAAPYILNKKLLGYWNEGGAQVLFVPLKSSFAKEDGQGYEIVKSAVEAMNKELSRTYKGLVRVNCVCPDRIDNDSNRDRLDISQTVRFLCEKKSEFMNGENVGADAGMNKVWACHGNAGWDINQGKI